MASNGFRWLRQPFTIQKYIQTTSLNFFFHLTLSFPHLTYNIQYLKLVSKLFHLNKIHSLQNKGQFKRRTTTNPIHLQIISIQVE